MSVPVCVFVCACVLCPALALNFKRSRTLLTGEQSPRGLTGPAAIQPAPAVLAGCGLLALLQRRSALSAEDSRNISLGANWGLASVAGWNIAVMVGGPVSGLATTIYANRLFEKRLWLMAATMVGARATTAT